MCASMFESRGSLLAESTIIMKKKSISPERIHRMFDARELG